MALKRKRLSTLLAQRRVRRPRPDTTGTHQLVARERDAIKYTLAFLVHDGLLDPNDLPGLFDRTAEAVSAKKLGHDFPKPSSPLQPLQVRVSGSEEAQLWVTEWGSARSALEAALMGREGKGRKPGWLKILARMADEEERVEIGSLPESKYKFAGIPRTPKVPIEQSVYDDHIVCLVDGSKRTFLTRYLFAKFGMTPQDYRIHFGLPSDYPMTASNYRTLRSRLAHDQGFGLPPGKTRK